MLKKKLNFVTLSSDFEKQSQGVGNMEGVIYTINPRAKVIHLMHGIPPFDILSAARAMETVFFMPVGCHVCVVDPGVGTKRKGIIVKVKRGDYFIGPDNGCLMTALRLLGGIKKVVEISNRKYMRETISPIFHGRDVFSPVAAHLSRGVPIEKFGKELKAKTCVQAPYQEAVFLERKIEAIVIHKNHFGSLHLNILEEEWKKLKVKFGEKVKISFKGKKIEVPFVHTFGDVKKDDVLIIKDDYNRIEVAINQGNFSQKLGLNIGESVTIEHSKKKSKK